MIVLYVEYVENWTFIYTTNNKRKQCIILFKLWDNNVSLFNVFFSYAWDYKKIILKMHRQYSLVSWTVLMDITFLCQML